MNYVILESRDLKTQPKLWPSLSPSQTKVGHITTGNEFSHFWLKVDLYDLLLKEALLLLTEIIFSIKCNKRLREENSGKKGNIPLLRKEI